MIQCEAQGANEHQIEESQKLSAKWKRLSAIPDGLCSRQRDFIHHYETRVAEGAMVAGKAMFCLHEPQYRL